MAKTLPLSAGPFVEAASCRLSDSADFTMGRPREPANAESGRMPLLRAGQPPVFSSYGLAGRLVNFAFQVHNDPFEKEATWIA